MAGTIRKVTSNTLTYSQDFSSLFSDDSEHSSDSYEDEVEEVGNMEFDLRSTCDTDAGNEEIFDDAPPVESETVIPLESPPSVKTVSDSVRSSPMAVKVVCQTKSVPLQTCTSPDRKLEERMPPLVVPRHPEIQRRNLSQLVDELVGSPILPKLGNKPARRTIPKSTKLTKTPSIFPVSRTARQAPSVPPASQAFQPFNPRAMHGWKCPDSWIPNHVCDSFCFEALRTF